MGSLKNVKHFALDWGTYLKLSSLGKKVFAGHGCSLSTPGITFTGKLTASNTVVLVSVIKLFQSFINQ